MLCYIIGIVVAVPLLGWLGFSLLVKKRGNARPVFLPDTERIFSPVAKTDKTVTLRRKVSYKNLGKQASTIVDCVVRPQLPFEQYDGVDIRGRAERVGAPREDDYFEAYIVEPGKAADIFIELKLTARRGLTIQEALARMVDVPVDIIVTLLSREPYVIKKDRIVLRAEEAAAAVGVMLNAED